MSRSQYHRHSGGSGRQYKPSFRSPCLVESLEKLCEREHVTKNVTTEQVLLASGCRKVYWLCQTLSANFVVLSFAVYQKQAGIDVLTETRPVLT